ncbi:alpha/beta hydrolase [Aliidiomarina sp. B3213]|nr:alpha/beta hydrolase [Aliidiomarina sp. B3213]
MNSAKFITKKQPGVSRQRLSIQGIPAYQAMPAEKTSDKTILYLHGGGYVFGNENTHRQVVDGLALICNATVLMPFYRLAPEHPFPAALNDALTAYNDLLSLGVKPENIMIAGDSAGGGLAVALALELRNQSLPMPALLTLFSPWADLTVNLESHRSNAKIDPMLVPKGLHSCARAYCQNTPRNHPQCSPLFADLTGLPPIHIQVGSDEILIDDARKLHENAKKAGVETTLEVFEGMWHVFQLHSHQLPEATEALEKVSAHWCANKN